MNQRHNNRFLQQPIQQQPSLIEIKFDGRTFHVPEQNMLLIGPILDLCRRAREGDAIAIEVATACKIALPDRFGVSYWPMPEPDETASLKPKSVDLESTPNPEEIPDSPLTTEPLPIRDGAGEWQDVLIPRPYPPCQKDHAASE